MQSLQRKKHGKAVESTPVLIIPMVALYLHCCSASVIDTEQEPCSLESKTANTKQRILAPHPPTPSTSRPIAGPKLASITTKYRYENLVCRL